MEIRCPAVGWASQSGDCRDDQPNVFRGQILAFAVPYPDLNQPARNNESYDYDCDNLETFDTTNEYSAGAPNCETLAADLSCVGEGYLPTQPARTGTGVNPVCGSRQTEQCEGGLLACVGEIRNIVIEEAARCR
jgi:hypothetical protein